MALAAAYTGEAELDAVMDLIEPLAGVDNAEEAVFLGLLAATVRAAEVAQASANARNRIAEAVGPHTAYLVTLLAPLATHAAREFRQIASLSNTELDATSGDNHDFANLGPIH